MKNLSIRQVVVKYIPLAIIGFGIVDRLVQYLSNRSLWADEAPLAINIVNRSYGELLQPLDYGQGAPIGFLWVEKLATQLLGNNEYALRLFPFLGGIASLFLFYELAKRWIQWQAVPIAIALFSTLYYSVYYASELKQYSTDITVALLLSLTIVHISQKKSWHLGKLMAFCLLGAVLIWFSHPAVFVVAGIGIVALIQAIKMTKNRQSAIIISVFCLICFTSFLLAYFVSLRQLSSDKFFVNAWSSGFPSSILDINWIFKKLAKIFRNPLGFEKYQKTLAIVLCLSGCVSLLRRDRFVLLMILSPLIMTLFATYLHKYPFSERVLLFLIPFFILLIAQGSYFLGNQTFKYAKNPTLTKITFIISLVVLGWLLIPAFSKAGDRLVNPLTREEIKPILSYIKTHRKPGDITYVFQRGEYQFKYYADKYGYQPGSYIIGIDDLDDGEEVSPAEEKRYKNDLDQLKGHSRVWVLFSHNVRAEKKLVLSYLDQMGTQLNEVESPGAFGYLYDLSSSSHSGF